MDANGTRHHLLLGFDDWSSCTDSSGASLRMLWAGSPPSPSDVYWNAASNELTLRPELFQFARSPKDAPPIVANRRGAARDRYGNWYFIHDAAQSILVCSSGTSNVSTFWSVGVGLKCRAEQPGPFQPLETQPALSPLALAGLTVTIDHYLVVGVVNPPGLLRFDLHAGGPPEQLAWPEGVPFAPFDMSPDPCGGGVWILDRQNRRYWALDRHFRILPQDQAIAHLSSPRQDDFQPLDSSPVRATPAREFPMGITLAASSPVSAGDPVAIEGLPDGTVLILESLAGFGFSLIYRYRFGQQLGQPVSTESMKDLVEPSAGAAFQLRGLDFAFTSNPDRLYVASDNADQTYAFEISQSAGQLVLRPLADYFPMRQFGGKGLVASGGQVYYDFGTRWIPLIAQSRPRFVPDATIQTRVFDGREPDCVWHRLVLDACLPPETSVSVFSRTANSADQIGRASWRPEPRLYRRGDGSEQPYAPKDTVPGRGSFELLFQQAKGRYLQLRLELHGNGRVTPRLRALRAWYPRFSYLTNYLPAVYRDDPQSASFLDRFLANVEGMFTAIEDKIAISQVLYDFANAPADSLDWLSGWFGIVPDPSWDETRKRLFIRHAMDFFQYRGTIRGIEIALRLAFDPTVSESIFTDAAQETKPSSIRIVEKYRSRRSPGSLAAQTGLRTAQTQVIWRPQSGGSALGDLYTAALGLKARQPFPVVAPSDSAASAQWSKFSENTLGFVPSSAAANLQPWREFLERRYGTPDALNLAWRLGAGQAVSSFADVQFPSQLPADGAPLVDWFQFQSVVLPMRAAAHRFSVLLPVNRCGNFTPAEQQRRLDLATRIVSVEKPAHTIFDVKFYWALFRVGDARLGTDTLLDLGGRAPALMPALNTGVNYLGAGYLAPEYPQDVPERQILGRERLTRTTLSWQEDRQ